MKILHIILLILLFLIVLRFKNTKEKFQIKNLTNVNLLQSDGPSVKKCYDYINDPINNISKNKLDRCYNLTSEALTGPDIDNKCVGSEDLATIMEQHIHSAMIEGKYIDNFNKVLETEDNRFKPELGLTTQSDEDYPPTHDVYYDERSDALLNAYPRMTEEQKREKLDSLSIPILLPYVNEGKIETETIKLYYKNKPFKKFSLTGNVVTDTNNLDNNYCHKNFIDCSNELCNFIIKP